VAKAIGWPELAGRIWPNAGYVIGKETFAWARGSGRDAPIATVRSKVARPRGATAEGELPARRAYISGVPAGTHLSKDM